MTLEDDLGDAYYPVVYDEEDLLPMGAGEGEDDEDEQSRPTSALTRS